MFWTGHIMSVLPALLLIFSAVMKLMKPAAVVEGFAHFGLPERLLLGLGIVELACTLLYLIPRTAVLGAILLTGYLGGATLANLRVGESYVMTIVLGVCPVGRAVPARPTGAGADSFPQ